MGEKAEEVPLKFTKDAKKAGKKVPRDVRAKLLDKARRGQAKFLRGDMHGVSQVRVSDYRLAYEEADGFRRVLWLGHKRKVPY